MLTDDDLTTELRAAFRGVTDDLEYAGKVPTLRRPLVPAVPLVATAATVSALAVVWASSPDAVAPAPDTAPTSQAPAQPKQVTDTITVVGYTFTYKHAVGEERAHDLYAMFGEVTLPDDAQPIDAPVVVKAWVGTDPASGDHGVWVKAPTRNDASVFAVLSPTWTTEQLTDLLYNGSPD